MPGRTVRPGPRTPISAKLVANMITAAGADRVLTLDLHAGQIQGFFDIPTDNLYAAPVLVKDILDHHARRDLVIVSPDVGGVVRARQIARRLDADLAIIDKRRERAGVSEVMNIIGDVSGRRCILVDDIVDSAGTLCNAGLGLDRSRRVGGLRLCHARRAVGRRGGARRRLADRDAGHDRQHRRDRGGAAKRTTSARCRSRR